MSIENRPLQLIRWSRLATSLVSLRARFYRATSRLSTFVCLCFGYYQCHAVTCSHIRFGESVSAEKKSLVLRSQPKWPGGFRRKGP